MTDQPRMLSEDERTMSHFNKNVRGCRRRQNAKPALAYDPGCYYIECDPKQCACRMNDGDGGPLSEFIARWMQRHG